VTAGKKRMQGQPSSRLAWIVKGISTIAIFAAGIAMFVVQDAGLSNLGSFASPSCCLMQRKFVSSINLA